jgi:phenylpropionate dioxygenase-like ring-hydroxylating dioxygenase large terminal subunit/nucleoside-diphosphate-sugar epimerase
MRLDLPGGDSSIIVRGKDQQIRAYANVCTHRGARLTQAQAGRFTGGIVRPYHAWTYDPTSGALRGVPKHTDMSGCFKKDDWPLRAMRLQEYRGFLFLTASNKTPPLEDTLGNVQMALADWPLEDFVCVGRSEYLVDCNWKFLVQNTSETYHTSFVHKDSLGPMPSEPIAKFLGTAPIGHWDAVHVPGERSIVPMPGEEAPFPELSTTASTYFVSLFPTMQLNVTRDCAWWMRVLPSSASTTTVTLGFLFPRSTTMLPDFQQLLQPYIHRWDLAVREDNEISQNQHMASLNPLHKPGPYHGLEFAVHRFDNMVLDAVVGGHNTPAAAMARASAVHTQASGLRTNEASAWSPASPMVLPKAAGYQGVRMTSSCSSQPFSLPAGATVCVTGATGFIALHLVQQLLAEGYRVIATVRSSNERKLAPLAALAPLGDLQIMTGCDLLMPGSFDQAVSDAEVCFHTASPFWMDNRISQPMQQLVQPAEQGTVNVLDACARPSSRVQRVVLTSSFGAIMNVGGRDPWPMDFEYCEDHWNVSSAPDSEGSFPEPVNAHAYRWSKTVAEKAAWEHHGSTAGKFDVVTILPPMVLGESKQQLAGVEDLNQSSLIFFNMLAGNMQHVIPGSVGFADVSDVAKAHILAAKTPKAGGERYLCSGVTQTWLQIVEMLRMMYPAAPLPTSCPDGSTTQPCLLLRNDKIKEDLAMEFIPLHETLQAQCNALDQAGLLQL